MASAGATQSFEDGTLSIQPPLMVAGSDGVSWDLRCDVLVVGFGAAGAAAAIVAKEAGANTLVLERLEGGGASARSGGVVYAGGGTPQQKKHGYDDTPEEMFRYLRQETGDAVSEATLRKFCNDSPALLAWLESLGANFDSDATPPKTSYPKDGVYLYYSGNEPVPEYAAQARPAPRGHRTRGSWLSGKQLFEHLKARVNQLEIPVMTQSAVRRLITDQGGAVLGAEVWQLPPGSAEAAKHQKLMSKAGKIHDFAARRADKLRAQALAIELQSARPLKVRAERGLVLSTGGFIFNRAMVAQYAPKFRRAARLGMTGCDGSGIRLGESVGGVPARMEKGSAWRFINPPTAFPMGIVVNRQGQRFCNEQVYGAKLGVAMCEHHEGKAWLILDKKLRRAAIRECLFGGLWWFQWLPSLISMLGGPRGKTPEELAAKLGMPPAALRESIDRYTEAARHGKPDALGKSDNMRQPLEGPYYAIDIGDASKSPLPAITLGGLRVDESSGAVLGAQGRAIAGLYAAGRCAVGIASNNYVSGLSLADCLWSGRRAGRAAALLGDDSMSSPPL
jgi:3-oxo-5alpha-steroid 4-dehydrogenase